MILISGVEGKGLLETIGVGEQEELISLGLIWGPVYQIIRAGLSAVTVKKKMKSLVNLRGKDIVNEQCEAVYIYSCSSSDCDTASLPADSVGDQVVPNAEVEVENRDPREGGVVGGIGADAAWDNVTVTTDVSTPTRRGRTRSGSQTTPPSEQSVVSQDQEPERNVDQRQTERTESGGL